MTASDKFPGLRQRRLERGLPVGPITGDGAKIVEIGTVTRKDGSTMRFGREKGSKMFLDLAPDDSPIGLLKYSRRSLNERPQKDRNVVAVEFARVS